LAPLRPPPDSEKAKRAIRPGEEETLGWRPAIGLEIPGRSGWKLTQQLGAGGFGEVWIGEHAKLRQRRAFKFCFDDERLRALKREVTLVRLLRNALGERDDIVRFYELKLDEPPFYLESDLAPHGNLMQWAEKQGGLATVPLGQRIGLVAYTATALAAAHSIGVLHKDIKPTNILVFDAPDGTVRPRLVDFGIGTLADPSVLGHHGVTAAGFTRATIARSTGTPTYNPPEYVVGKPYTVQGDIYGLGVLLFQLVTADATRPVAPGWERDVSDPLLREDIAECVDGDPARRLSSATELAERLWKLDERRAARAQAAEARRQAEADRVRFVRRRLQLQIAALTIFVLFGLAATMLWSYRRERNQRKRAEEQTQLAIAARKDAESLVQFMVFGLSDRLEKAGGREISRDINLRAADYYRQLDTARLNPESLKQYVASLNQLGDALVAEGELEKAQGLYSRGLEILTERRRREPKAVFRNDLFVSLAKVAGIAHAQGDVELARTNLLQALALGRDMARDYPNRLDAQRYPSIALARLAELEKEEQNLPEAIVYQREALEISRAIAVKSPKMLQAIRDVAADETTLADLLTLSGDKAAAAALTRSSLSARRSLVEQHPKNMSLLLDLIATLSRFTALLLTEEHFFDADAPARETIQIAEQLTARDPKNLVWRRNLAIAYAVAADVARGTGQLAIARQYIEKAHEITASAAAQEPSRARWQEDLGSALERLARVQALQGERDSAITNQTRSFEIFQKLAAQQIETSAHLADLARTAGELSNFHETRGTPGRTEALRYAKVESETLNRLKKAGRLLPEQSARLRAVNERIDQLESAR
jgi:serine/threonine-protein kinase